MSLRRRLLGGLGLALALGSSPGVVAASAAELGPEEARAAVEAMKRAPRGPFERIRWFCNDGSVQPPRAYACAERGGGVQHGELSEQARALRESGWLLANLLVAVDPQDFVGRDARLDLLKQILLERFLITWDDGWIFRGARSYRGAIQAEDEERGARELVDALLADPAWRTPVRFFLLRETVRLLPLASDSESATAVRALAVVIEEKDPDFRPLRAKIHGQPDPGDAERIRAYARARGRPELADDYEELAASIEALTRGASVQDLEALAGRVEDPVLATALRRTGRALAAGPAPRERLEHSVTLLAELRDALPRVQDPPVARALLALSLGVEARAYAAGVQSMPELPGLDRDERLQLLQLGFAGLYGAGFLSRRQLDALRESVSQLRARPELPLDEYRRELRYLARSSEWSSRWIEFHFGPTIESWERIAPQARLYPQDRVRGSPLFFHDAVADTLAADAHQLAGIEHQLFGARVGTGLRALNPGLARGVLRESTGGEVPTDPDGIYLLPETTSDLGRVAGILTRGEGSSLSHVQLLARNLGIPNVVVGVRHLPALRERVGQRVVLSASPGGAVEIDADGPRWQEVFEQESGAGAPILRPDLEKLDLESVEIRGLDELRASDSGRTSGPKGANLGELRHHFGDAVPDGVVVPFGVFRRVLDSPLEPGGPSVWQWMQRSYDEIQALPRGDARRQRTSAFLARFREWIRQADPGPRFREQLEAALIERFGPDGTWGVFVRSDTNVEDLPGFTGAGLNLTLFNVVGVGNVLEAIGQVWASPFTERAYGWRQANMEDPEYVMPAVVIQRAYPSVKSGVMATVDLETGSREWLTVAASEGVGGAVEGQAAESLRIPLDGGPPRLLAQATAPERQVLRPGGGVGHEPASGTDELLRPGEIAQLVELARKVSRFPSLRDERGRALPADVEFGFGAEQRLVVLQIRPLNESGQARRSAYLRERDRATATSAARSVRLDQVPAATEASP